MKLNWGEQLAEFTSKCDKLVADRKSFADEIKGISSKLRSRSKLMKEVAADATHSVKSGEMKAVVSKKLTKDDVDRKQAKKQHYDPVVVDLENAVKKLKKYDKDTEKLVKKMKLRLADLENKVSANEARDSKISRGVDGISNSYLGMKSALRAHNNTLNSIS